MLLFMLSCIYVCNELSHYLNLNGIRANCPDFKLTLQTDMLILIHNFLIFVGLVHEESIHHVLSY